MSSFISLPRELRQRILLSALPEVVRPAISPYLSIAVQNFLHANRTIRQDMQWVLNHYSPQFYFHSPSHLADFLSSIAKSRAAAPFDYAPTIEHVSFSIFHDAKVDTMLWTCYCVGRAMRTHDELVHAWTAALPALLPPASALKSLRLDITPAPGWMRDTRPHWIHGFLQDRRVARTFFPEFEAVALALVQAVPACFGPGRVGVLLVGQLSEKSRPSLDSLVARTVAAGVPVDFVGEMLPVQHVLKPDIDAAVRKLAPARRARKRDGAGGAGEEDEEGFVRLRDVTWSGETQKLWTRTAMVDEERAIALLVALGRFVASDEVERMDGLPAEAVQRALLHHMAKDLGYSTGSLGEEPERFVRIEKTSKIITGAVA